MGRYDWSAICSVECIQYDGYKDTLRVRCYWKCNGWRYNMRPVYGYVYRAGEGEICVAMVYRLIFKTTKVNMN